MTVNPAFVLLLFLGATQAESCRTCDNQDADLCDYVPLARHRGFAWLLKDQSAPSQTADQFDLDQMFALLSLQLTYPDFFSELRPHEREFFRSVQESTMLSALARAKANQRRGDIVPYLDPVQFAQQLLTMEATCINTRNFFGQDLQYHLSILTRDFPESNYDNAFQFAFSLLPLCSTNFELYEKVWIKLLRVRDSKRPCVVIPREEFEGPDEKYAAHTIATLSMLVMTMRCARNQVPEKYREMFFERFNQRVECIAGWQNKTNYGFGGNVQVTALAVQALYAADVDSTKWNCSGAIHHILKSQNLDGSFGYGTSEETALVLPALANRHLGGLGEADFECPGGRNRPNLPRPIGPFDNLQTFTLVVYNEIRNMHRYHNITIIDGENLLQALVRARLDENIDFEFTAERFTFRDEEGIFLTSVNGVENDRQRFYRWFVKKHSDDEEEEDEEDDELLSLDDVEPDEDTKIILAYVDVTPDRFRPPELPRPIEKDDEYFNLTIKVANEITGEESVHYTPIIEGENLLQALLRAWKAPFSTFNFAAEPAQIFNKNGVFLKSVNGVKADKENFYFWLVKDDNEDDGEEEMKDGSTFQLKGLLEYTPKSGYPVNLAYVDISAYKDQVNPSGKGKHELPEDFEDGDSKVDFTLSLFNSITKRKMTYNVTIKEGENLLHAFLRGWKDVEMFPSFGAEVFPFFGKQNLYISSINGLANDRENLYYWIVVEDLMPDQELEDKELMPTGLTEVIPEDGQEIHVIYADLRKLFEGEEGGMGMDRDMQGMDRDMEGMDQDMEGMDEDMEGMDRDMEGMDEDMEGRDRGREGMDVRRSETPREIRDCDTTINITVYVVNNITQTYDSFNLTIIEGEDFHQALLRAWKDPEINFNFAFEPFNFLDKPGVYLSSVNGLAINLEEYTYWLVKLADKDEDEDNFEPMDIEFVPRQGEIVTLLYADLSPLKDQLKMARAELPPRIEEEDQTVTFTLYLINEIRREHSGFNITILEGETLLDGLHRAWKNKSNYFNFGAARIEFLDRNGIFLTTVNGIANSRIDNYRWVVKHEMSDKDQLIDYKPTSLNKLKPTNGSAVKLVYADISEIFEERRRYDARGEFPRFVRRSDDVFTMTLVVLNNITQEHSKYDVKVIRGENLVHALLRAWKDPYVDFNFAAEPSSFFSKPGVYLTSVNGVSNDPDQAYYWLVKDAPKCEDPRMMDGSMMDNDMMDDNMMMGGMMMGGMMMGGMMMGEGMPDDRMDEDEDSFKPYGLEEYVPEPRKVVMLVYVDLGPLKDRVTASGLGNRELPKMIEDGDNSIDFTLITYNSENNRKSTFDMTILKGESLFVAFLRMWKNPEIDFHFTVQPFEFFGEHGLFITSINGVSNDRETGYHWIIKPNGKESERDDDDDDDEEGEDEEGEMFEVLGLTDFIPEDGGEVHVAYVNLREQLRRFREEAEEEGDMMQGGPDMMQGGPEMMGGEMMEGGEDEEMGRLGDIPKDITACDSTADITVYVVNNITQTHEGFNLTIIEGENLYLALLRAWKDPEINFNFAAAPFIFFFKPGLYLTSVNGLAKSKTDLSFWLVKKGDEEEEEDEEDFPKGLLEFIPEDGAKVILTYADLSPYKDDLLAGKEELPRPIKEDDVTATFTLYTIDTLRQEHKGYNITILEGETILDGFKRAWKSWDSYFNFAAAPMRFANKRGVFLTSVNGVRNNRETRYCWLLLDGDADPSRKVPPAEFEPIGLTEVKPTDGSVFQLAYLDLTHIFSRRQPPLELPREIRDDDDTFVLQILVGNNITGEHSVYNVTMIEDEPLLYGLLRAWKAPNSDFNFDTAVFKFFDKEDYFPTSVLGVRNDLDKNYYWIVVDSKHEEEGEMDSNFQPIGLTEYKPREDVPVKLIYLDLSPWMHDLNPTGEGRHELPKDIEDGASTVNFTLNVYNDILKRKRSYEVIIVEGENLFDAFLRLWKEPEVEFTFAAAPFYFGEKFSYFVYNINGLSSRPMDCFYWIVLGEVNPEDEEERGMPEFNPLGLREVVPTNGGEVHIVYKDLSPYKEQLDREEEERGMMMREGGMMMGGMGEMGERMMEDNGEDHDGLPREIEDDDRTLNISIYVVNNITQTKEGFNVTIIRGETLIHALLRAWKDPEINFNFATKTFTFFEKYEVFLSSVNGVANNYADFYYWLVKREGDEGRDGNFEPMGLLGTMLRPNDKIILIYADLSQYRDQLTVPELPPNIQDGDETVDFSLYVLNYVTKQLCTYNLSVLAGENLLDGLFRAWKDPEQYFNFAAAGFRFLNRYGIFLISVNGVENEYDGEGIYHWLAEIASTPEEEMMKPEEMMEMMMMMNSTMEYQPRGLQEFIPMAGTDIKLVYMDVTPFLQERQMMQGEPDDAEGGPGGNQGGNQGGNPGGNQGGNQGGPGGP